MKTPEEIAKEAEDFCALMEVIGKGENPDAMYPGNEEVVEDLLFLSGTPENALYVANLIFGRHPGTAVDEVDLITDNTSSEMDCSYITYNAESMFLYIVEEDSRGSVVIIDREYTQKPTKEEINATKRKSPTLSAFFRR